ncbi:MULTISPECIES: hypothetical protein [unclassified Kribbella]|uniref:hypothetical protein n=1 Tax=unclassified Kribbella TaxID=2644121 RepID=UPI00301AB0C8
MRQTGLTVESLTAASAWSVFGSFSGIEFDVPREPDSDGLLYQFGIYDFSGEPRFHLDLTRQFGLRDSEEYLQFHCDLQYLPTPRLEVLGSHSEWWFRGDGRQLPEWFAAVNQRPEWPVLESALPTAVEVYCDET